MYLYKILGVSNTSTKDQIKASYRNLAKLYHPDLNDDVGFDIVFKTIKLAYDILIDDYQRNLYNQSSNQGITIVSSTIENIIKGRIKDAYKNDLVLSVDAKKRVSYNTNLTKAEIIKQYCVLNSVSLMAVEQIIEQYTTELGIENNHSNTLSHFEDFGKGKSMKFFNFMYKIGYLIITFFFILSISDFFNDYVQIYNMDFALLISNWMNILAIISNLIYLRLLFKMFSARRNDDYNMFANVNISISIHIIIFNFISYSLLYFWYGYSYYLMIMFVSFLLVYCTYHLPVLIYMNKRINQKKIKTSDFFKAYIQSLA